MKHQIQRCEHRAQLRNPQANIDSGIVAPLLLHIIQQQELAAIDQPPDGACQAVNATEMLRAEESSRRDREQRVKQRPAKTEKRETDVERVQVPDQKLCGLHAEPQREPGRN